MTTRAENLSGAGWMTLSQAGYVINDSMVKVAVEDVPLFEVIFVRGVIICTLLTIAAAQLGLLAQIRKYITRAIVIRVAAETTGTIVYLTALAHAPIAGLNAIQQIVPIAVTFIAARLLRERVSWHRVGSVTVGFVGVLIIVRPGSDGFNPWLLLGLLVVVAIVVRDLATTRVPQETPALVISLATAVSVTIMGGVGSIAEGWEPISRSNLALIAGAAGFLIVAYMASVITVRVGDLSFSAPFRYTVLLFAIILQIVVFDDVPDALTFIGAALIAAAGIYIFRRETRTTRIVS